MEKTHGQSLANDQEKIRACSGRFIDFGCLWQLKWEELWNDRKDERKLDAAQANININILKLLDCMGKGCRFNVTDEMRL